jgi:D-alanyl-D-alanine carboxypeptidase/D-alanyl-D-alanine-endopeptidase (penicillin-binding protein 4)
MRAWAALAAASVVVAALVASTTSSAAAPTLDLALGRAVQAPGVAASQTAAIAVDLRSGETLFSQNGRRGLLPASAEKLSVSFTALHLLGPRFRFRTELVGKGSRSGGTW